MMDQFLERLWERLDSYGLVGLLLFAFIVGTAWIVRQLWYWGFREPDHNASDRGGWMTRFFDSTIIAQQETVTTQKVLVELVQKQAEASNRHDAKLDILIGRSPCLQKPDPGAR